MIDSVMGGAMGAGIDINIKEIYIWLACNYDAGDEGAFSSLFALLIKNDHGCSAPNFRH